MKKNKMVSIIVPIYNAEKVIKTCIESILNQTYKDLELLLIDDGSTDNSKNICTKYADIDGRVKYFHKKNGGVSTARNYGLNNIKGDYVFFLDADDYLDNNAIECLVDNYSEGTIVGLKHTNVYLRHKIEINYNNIYSTEELIDNILTGKMNGVIWGYLISVKDIKNIRFDENTYFLEDMLFLITLMTKSDISKIIFVDSQYYYFINDNSITSNPEKSNEKCSKIIYSLDRINKVTNEKYRDKIENKKIVLLEKQLRFSKSAKDIERCFDGISLPRYHGKNKIYRLYSYLVNHNKYKQINVYYKIRRIIKKIMKK